MNILLTYHLKFFHFCHVFDIQIEFATVSEISFYAERRHEATTIQRGIFNFTKSTNEEHLQLLDFINSLKCKAVALSGVDAFSSQFKTAPAPELVRLPINMRDFYKPGMLFSSTSHNNRGSVTCYRIRISLLA